MPQRLATSVANAWVVSCLVFSVRSTYLQISFGVAALDGNFNPRGIVCRSCLCRCARLGKAGLDGKCSLLYMRKGFGNACNDAGLRACCRSTAATYLTILSLQRNQTILIGYQVH